MEGILLFIVIIPVIVFIVTSLFRYLWCITMPQVFGLRPITFWQAFRLLLLAGMLFSGNFLNFSIGG
jgi:hypothetical protein